MTVLTLSPGRTRPSIPGRIPGARRPYMEENFGAAQLDSGLWTPTDSESKITVTGGNLDFSGGLATPAWGDPRVVTRNGYARAIGLTLEWESTAEDTTKEVQFGFGTVASPGVNQLAGFSAYGGEYYVVPRDGDSANFRLPLVVGLTSRRWRVVTDTNGGFFYTSRDSGTTWEVVWITPNGSTSLFYPVVNVNSMPLTSSKCEVSLGSVIPALLSASPAAPTLTLGPELNSGTLAVGSWYSITATQVDYFFAGCAIGNIFRATAATALDANNKVKLLSFDTTGCLTYSGDSGKKLGIAKANITVAALYHAGFVVCADSATAPTNCFYLYYDRTAGKAYLMKITAGVTAELVAATVAYGAANELRIVITGPVTAARVGLYYGTSGAPTFHGTIQGPYDLSSYGSHTFGFQTSAAELVQNFEFHGGVGI